MEIRLYHSRRWLVRLKWEPRDLWVGVYWDLRRPLALNVFICIVPMLPIHVTRFLPLWPRKR